MQANNFGGTFDQLFLCIFMRFSQKMPLYFFYTMVQKVENDENWNQGVLPGPPSGITIGLEIGHLTKITFWCLLKVPFRADLLVETVWKIQRQSWNNCHQSCLIALVVCPKLYIKLAVSLCSFSQFSFPFNFWMANALVLKFGTLPLRCLFSNTLLAIFDSIFRSRVIHCFVPKMGQNWHAGVFFNITLFQKRL